MIYTSDKFTMFVGEEYHLTNYPKTTITNNSNSVVQVQGKSYTSEYVVLHELQSNETKEVVFTDNIIRLVSTNPQATVYVKSNTPKHNTGGSTSNSASDERISAIEQRIDGLATNVALNALSERMELVERNKSIPTADNNLMLPTYINWNKSSHSLGFGTVYPSLIPEVGTTVTMTIIANMANGRKLSAYNTNTSIPFGEFTQVKDNTYVLTFIWTNTNGITTFNNEDSEILLRQSKGNGVSTIKHIKLELGDKSTYHEFDYANRIALLETKEVDVLGAINKLTPQQKQQFLQGLIGKDSDKEKLLFDYQLREQRSQVISTDIPFTGEFYTNNQWITLRNGKAVFDGLDTYDEESNPVGQQSAVLRAKLQKNKFYTINLFLSLNDFNDIQVFISNNPNLTAVPAYNSEPYSQQSPATFLKSLYQNGYIRYEYLKGFNEQETNGEYFYTPKYKQIVSQSSMDFYLGVNMENPKGKTWLAIKDDKLIVLTEYLRNLSTDIYDEYQDDIYLYFIYNGTYLRINILESI